jgi:spoIIIJ-associated protein
MEAEESARKILDTMLGHLGFTATIEVEQTGDGPCLQIRAAESHLLIGEGGDRLDDLQYLVNRVLRRQMPKAERIRVDCEHFRAMQEERLREEILSVAERVKSSGRPYRLRPLNAYYRRLVHNILQADDEVVSHSPEGEERLKRITISAKHPPEVATEE